MVLEGEVYDNMVNLEMVAKNVNNHFGDEVAFAHNNNTVMVYGVDFNDLKEFVENEFSDFVYDVDHDYDYGYDEYMDDLTVANNRFVLYCHSCMKDCDDCVNCNDY